jgi:hypothetical protein
MVGDLENGLHLLREMFRLVREEDICDASISRAYYDAFQIAIGHGDKARAKVFAERAYMARMIVEGAQGIQSHSEPMDHTHKQ